MLFVENLTNNRYNAVTMDVTDPSGVSDLVKNVQPDEYYNLAAMSHVGQSFKEPASTLMADGMAVTYALEAIKNYAPNCKFYQASTSELYGKVEEGLKLDENSEFKPRSPYGAAKMYAHNMVSIYRDSYGIHGSCGILFNHESERRGENFVTRKITKWIAEFVRWTEIQGLDASPRHFEFIEDQIHSRRESFPKLRLGNVDAYRDWGHAQDYVYAMWLMLQQTNPDDYVIATGETHSVREFLDKAFQHIGIDNYEDFFVIDEKFYRPSEVEYLKGIPTKAEQNLGWERKVSFDDLVKRMVDSDIHAEEKKKQPQWQVRFVP